MSPIPPASITLVTEFLDICQNVIFPLFSYIFATVVDIYAQIFISYQEKHYGRDGLVLWYGLYPPARVGIVTENPFTGRKAQKCPNVLKEH